MLIGESKMPALLSQFPENGKKHNEETYLNESVLGHKFLNKAYKAIYEVGNDNFSIFLMQNNSPEETIKTVNNYLKATGLESMESNSEKIMINDGYNGSVFVAWKENLIVIISGLSKDQTEIADRYTSEILK
jgi:hypothetical protein